jgi:dTDP-4-amino-4,6-dideoxygalactose transaminase
VTLPLFKVHMPSDVDGPLLETLHSGFVGQGKKVAEFEKALIDEVQNSRVLTVNNGTAALRLALRLANVGPGDRVISTPMTCMASNTVVNEQFAEIDWADIEPDTGNIDPFSIVSRIGPRTKAIIAVHWGGYPADMDSINEIADDYGLAVIEDAAHAFGAVYKGARVGALSRFAAFSFQAIKHLTTVDGGALACERDEDYARGKLLRWYGIDREQPRQDFRCEADVAETGYKSHMNDIAATIGLVQLGHVRGVIEAHRLNAFYYNCEIECRGLRHIKSLAYRDDRISSYWLYTALVDDRPSFMAHMAANGIQASRVHARNDRHSCFRDAGFQGDLPGVDEFDAHQVSIPVGWWVGQEEREAVMDAIEAWDRERG